MKRYFTSIMTLFMLMLFAIPTFAATVATGNPDGFYHGALFATFKSAVERASRGELDLEYANEDGTDGTVANLEMVDAGEADLAFVQKGGTAIKNYPNVQIIGNFGYEVPHLVVPANSKIKSCDVLESKTDYVIGMNTYSGSAVTMAVMTKVDKDYAKATIVDMPDSADAEMSMSDGSIHGYFFVSTPGSGTVKNFNNKSYRFVDCWDGDFDEYDVNGSQLYEKVRMKKKMGYPNNFTTFSVPGVVVANKAFLKEERTHKRTLLNATKATFSAVKSAKKFNFYPED